MIAVLAVLPAVAGGCGERDPAKRAKLLRVKFLEALRSYYFDRNRELAVEHNPEPPAVGAPLVHEYIIDPQKVSFTRYPDTEDKPLPEGMPAAKRKLLYPAKDDPRAEEAVADAYEAVVTYLVITYKREEQKLMIPVDPVDPLLKPEMQALEEKDVVRPVYLPIVYTRGRHHFVYHGGRLVPDDEPDEDPLTEEERGRIINPPEAPTAQK